MHATRVTLAGRLLCVTGRLYLVCTTHVEAVDAPVMAPLPIQGFDGTQPSEQAQSA